MTVGDPRPARRVADPQAGIEKVKQERKCRACGRRGLNYLNRAHLVPKGQRGDDVPENIVPLCGSGTDGCHGALTSHHRATYPSLLSGGAWTYVADSLRRRLHDDELEYILTKKKLDWLNKTYPLLTGGI